MTKAKEILCNYLGATDLNSPIHFSTDEIMTDLALKLKGINVKPPHKP
jgi:hypothetical protein